MNLESQRRQYDLVEAARGYGYRTMTEAANELGFTNHVIRRLVKDGILPAKRLVDGAPYQIHSHDLHSEAVKTAIKRKGRPCRAVSENQLSVFPTTYRESAQ